MIEPAIDKLLENVESRYMLVTIISKRAREIVEGSHLLEGEDKINAVDNAINEYYKGRIEYKVKE